MVDNADRQGGVTIDKLDLIEGVGSIKDRAVVAGGKEVLISGRSSHSVGLDGPWICAFHQIAALDSPFVLGYPYLILSALGWAWGSVATVLFGVLSYYCNICLASIHEVGGVRNIRYRDLMSRVVGKWSYYPTWIIQYINLLAGNVGLVILAGQFLKAVHDQYSMNQNIKLTEWIAISTAVMALFTFAVPHLHHLRIFSGLAMGLIFVFVGIAVAISIHDGTNNGPQSYSLFGSPATKAFNALGAVGSLAFAYNIVIMPEIQATIAPPAVRNMYKSIAIQYVFAMTLWVVLTFVSYWAYGNGVYPNILANLSGPKWAITIAQLSAWLQCIISTQIFAAPVYESLDTKFGREAESTWSFYNTLSRVVMRGLYWAATAFVAMLLPFFGDFIALIGALAVFPCSIIFPLVLTAIVHKKTWSPLLRGAHWVAAFLLTLLCIAATVASIRFIIIDAVNYNVFANQGQTG